MSMSTHIQAFIPDQDAEYKRHKIVLLVCSDAKVSLPEETAQYFGSKVADKALLEEKLQIMLTKGEHYVDYDEDMCQGFEVDLTKLPKGVTKLRFFNSY